jgi:hypothetical protein
VLNEEQGAVEQPQQMSGFISLAVGEGGEEAVVGIRRNALSGDEELIHAHGGIQG